MKKIFKSLAALALIAFAASCSKEQAVEAIPSGEEALVSFTVSTPALQTKAIADGNTVDKVSCNVYDAEGALISNSEISKTIAISGGKATFSVRLVTGQTYSFIFWAYKEGAPYTFSAADKKVTVSYTDAASNDESRDAFYAYVAPLQVTGALNKTVTLYRPFAQVNFGVTEVDFTAAENAGIEVAKSSVKLTGLATELNLVDGTVSGSEDAEFALAALPEEKLTVGTTEYNYVAMNYVLVGKDAKSLSDAELKLYDSADAAINTVSVPNIPLQGNYRTNILGALFTSVANFNLVVDPAFVEPDYEVEIWDGVTVNEPSVDAEGNYLITKASELAWVAQQTNAGTTFKGNTFKLQNDIDLRNNAWTPIGNATNVFNGLFDGQKHTVSNLYIHSAVSSASGLGLFGNVYGDDGATTGIKDLVIDGAEVVSEVTAAGCGVAAGVFSGHAVAENVKVINATVKNSHYVGGIAGSAYGYFRNCTVESTELISYTELTSNGYDYADKVGGIVGFFTEGSRDISNCTVKNVKITGYRDLGGIVGIAHDNTTVKDCSVEGVTITIDETNAYKTLDATADAHNVHAVIGRKGTNQTDSDNTGTATITFKE